MKHLRGNLVIEFSVYKRIMWIVGAWPLSNKQCFFNIRWLFGMIVEFSVGVPAFVEALNLRSEYGPNLDNLYVLQVCLLSFLKNLLFRLRSAKLQDNVIQALHVWSHPRDKLFYMLMKKRAKLYRITSAGLIVSGFICFTTIFIAYVIFPWTPSNMSDKLVRNYFLPFGPLEDISDWEHRWWLLLQFFVACVLYMRHYVIDSFFFCATMHLCAQFDILKLEFLNFHGNSFTDTQYRLELGALVRRHCELFDLAKNLEYSFHRIIFIQVAVSIFLLGGSGLQLVTALKRAAFFDAAQCVPFITFLILQTGIYAHAGQTLFDESRNILQTLYDIEWQSLRPARTKDLILIMIRSNVPFYISGGKFFNMCYSAIFGMIQRVFTYVTFLQIADNYKMPSKVLVPMVRA